MNHTLRLVSRPHVVYYLELFQHGTNPGTAQEPYKRLGPFEMPIAFNHFMTFENGVNDDDIGLHVDDNGIWYRAQPDDESLRDMSMVRIVAEVVS